MNASQSIYADPLRTSICRSRTAREARRARAELRRDAVLSDGPPRRLDRADRLIETLRAYRSGPLGHSPLAALNQEIQAELDPLEQWAAEQSPDQQKSGPVIRQALDFLRAFGRLTVLDFSRIPDEDREQLVLTLALEHRWCYAAAGTTREAFKAAAGRTGAR